MTKKTATRMGKGDGNEYIPGHSHLAYREQERRPDSSLHVGRACQPLDRWVVVCLLPDHRPGFLVALHILDGRLGRRRTNGALLASLAGPGLHRLYFMDVQALAPRHGYYRR